MAIFNRKKSKASKVETPGKAVDRLTHEDIARRAYELYLERGGGDGQHEEDWQRAEKELERRPV